MICTKKYLLCIKKITIKCIFQYADVYLSFESLKFSRKALQPNENSTWYDVYCYINHPKMGIKNQTYS